MVDQIGVCVAVDLEADGDAFGGGDAVYVLDVWDAAADGEARDDWGCGVVEMGSYRKGLCLVGWCEFPFNEKAFGVGW